MRLLAETHTGRNEREALRHHARRRLEPGQQDRQLADRARRLRRPAAAVQPRLPGGREHPAVALRGRGGRRGLRARPGASSWRTTRSRRSWGGSATTPARRPATARSSTRPWGSTRSSASSATRPSRRAGGRRDAAPSGQARAGRRRRALRALRRVPPAPARPRGDDPRGRADGGRDDAIRDPQVPPAARRARRRGPADPRHGRHARAEPQGHEHPGDACRRGASTPPSSRSAPTSASAPTSRPARPRGSSTPSRCFAAWRARRSRCWGGASSSTAAATPRWTSRAPPSGSAPRRRSSSTGARASGCRRTTSRSRRPRRRAC